MNAIPEKITLVCLPYSGASINCYKKLYPHLHESIEPFPVELPGHGKRYSERFHTDVHGIVDDFEERLVPVCARGPYAIFGHSLGALLAYLLTRRLVDRGCRAPCHLFVSGRAAPSVPVSGRPRHQLARADFIRELRRLGGSPSEVLDDPELMDVFEPVIRADFEAIETYRHVPADAFDIPLTVMIGCDDGVMPEDVSKWGQVSRRAPSVLTFSGGHFFIFDHWAEIGHAITNGLMEVACRG
jgi:surfactin synthase thioesterase subunit